MKKILATAFLVVLATGCTSPSVQMELMPAASYYQSQPRDPNHVAFLGAGKKPKGPFVEAARVGVHGRPQTTQRQMEQALLKEGAKLGADFVIVTNQDREEVGQVGHVMMNNYNSFGAGGTVFANNVSVPHLYGSACFYLNAWLGCVFANGLEVEYVTKDAPAGKAGIKEGEKILAVDGQYISDLPDLTQFLATKSPGNKVRVEVLDGQKNKREVIVALEAPPGR